MPKKPKRDNHKSGFMIRLPESYREGFAELKRKLGQAYTVAAQRAVDAYMKVNGIRPPESTR